MFRIKANIFGSAFLRNPFSLKQLPIKGTPLAVLYIIKNCKDDNNFNKCKAYFLFVSGISETVKNSVCHNNRYKMKILLQPIGAIII